MRFLFIILISLQLLGQSFEQEVYTRLINDFPEYEKIEIQRANKIDQDEKIILDYSRKVNLLRGTAVIPVFVLKGAGKTVSVVSFKVLLYKKVLVASRDYEKKEQLNQNGFEEKVVDVTFFNGKPLNNASEISSLRAKSFIKRNEILISEKTEKIPLINTGDKVIAEVRTGSVIIKTEAFARQCGHAGDIIELVSLNNKILKARIFDANKVIVE